VRTPYAFQFRRFSAYVSYFVLGVIVGALIFLYMQGQTMDRIMLENHYLISTNNKLTEELETLQEDINEMDQEQQEQLVVKTIEVDVVDPDNETDGFVKTEVADQLRDDVKSLINRPLEDLAATSTAVQNLIHNREYEVDDQKIVVRFHSMVIYTTLTIRISIEEDA
jgi:hypothetical protein